MPSTTRTRISVPVKQTTPPKSESEGPLKTLASQPRTKTRAVPRRRAPRRGGETDSEEEIVREPRSDSETESIDSSLDSEDDLDSEMDDESKSDEPVQEIEQKPIEPAAEQPKSIFVQPHDWNDSVAAENASGQQESLPVLEWGDMASHDRPASPPMNAVPSPPPSDSDKPAPSRSGAPRASFIKRKVGETARQAYLNKLNTDPAYVPTVGQFWSHDDRLLEKDLRSLSGWWRGRWQGRGRGMRGRGGFGPGFVNRGRGGMIGQPSRPVDDLNAPPVERTWTHDGFEELNKDEEVAPLAQQDWSNDRGGSSRGRGGARGRGFFGRGGFASNRSTSPHGLFGGRTPTDSHRSTTSDKLQFGNGLRPWFAMKPEPVWTKQSEAYLFRGKPPQTHSIRIKLPSSQSEKPEPIVVKLSAVTLHSKGTPISKSESLPPDSIAVKLPSLKSKGKQPEPFIFEDVVTVGPPPMPEDVRQSKPETSGLSRPQVNGWPISPSGYTAPSRPPGLAQIQFANEQPVEPLSNGAISGPLGVMHPSPLSPHEQMASVSNGQQPPMHMQPPLTVASPFQASPSYGSPYPYSQSSLPLPPGIGMLENGMTYEIATGRAVYLQTPPPPPPPPPMQMPMYNPRPIPLHHAAHPSVHFVPHHASSMSMSMSVSPPNMMHTPPLFSLPRQGSRVEIKAPGEEKGKEEGFHSRPASQAHTASTSRLANVHAEPFTPSSQLQATGAPEMGYYDAQQHAYEEAQRHQQYMYSQPGYYYPVGTDGAPAYGYPQQYGSGEPTQNNPYVDAYGQEAYPPAAYY